MYVQSKRDLETMFMIIRMTEQLLKDSSTDDEELTKKRKEYLVSLKKDTRDYYKRTANKDRSLIKDYGVDGYVELIELPEYLETKDDAREYFDEEEWIHAYPSMYDCTGQRFTNWAKIFQRRGRWMAYHRVSFDV